MLSHRLQTRSSGGTQDKCAGLGRCSSSPADRYAGKDQPLSNQPGQKVIPRVVLRSEKLEDFVVNSIKPRPLESDEGSWTFGKLRSGDSLSVVLDVTPTSPGSYRLKFAFESSGWELRRPDGKAAAFEVQTSVVKVGR